ncbi:MAG: hypothetical protein HYU63_02045 [Armatimonadetes bacterium]|nr:hypothetical protein [Armatimonadota bacterium]
MANTIGGGLPPFNIPSGYKESPPKKQDEERINQIKDKCKEYGLNISENPDPDEVAEIEGKLLKFNQIEAEHQKYGISIPKEKFKDSKEVEKMEKGLEVLKRGGITPEKLNELKEQIGIKVDDAGKGSSSSAKSAGSAKKYEGSRQAGSTAKTAKEAAKVEHGFGTTAGALAANKALSTGDEGLHKQTIQPQIRAKAGELTGQRNQILGSLKTDEKENLISSLNEGTGTAGAFGGAFGLPQMLGGDGSIIQMSAGLGLADPMAGMGKLGKTQITVSNDDSGAGQIDKYIGNYDKKISEK